MKITVISSTKPATLSKFIDRDADGRLFKTSSAHLTQGQADTCPVDSMAALNAVLDGLGPNQAVAYGLPPGDSLPLVSEKHLASAPGAITRSDRFFAWPEGAGIMVLDYDPPAQERSFNQAELLGALFSVLPQAAPGPWLWRPSASGNVYDAQTGEELAGLKGQRVYLAVADATDTPRAGQVLFRRLWLAGHGHIDIAANGAQLVRSLIDASMWQPSRLDFAAGAVCGHGLVRRPPPGIWAEGQLLDTRAILPDLTQDEERRYAQLVADAKAGTAGTAAQYREAHINAAATIQGVPVDAVRARYDLAESKGVLGNDFEIELAYGEGRVRVEDILRNADRYHGAICLDPLEPEYNNRHPVGKIFNDAKGAYIDSKAHGGRVFILGSIAALEFQQQASGGSAFRDLMADIRSNGCDLAEVGSLVERITSGPFCEAEATLLRAELEGGLKADKRLTPELRSLIHGKAQPVTTAPAAADRRPMVAPGQVLPMSAPLNPAMWAPDQATGKDWKPLGTLDNFRIMTGAYGVGIEFDEISKDLVLTVPGNRRGGALHDESAVSLLISLANLNQYPKSDVSSMITCLAHENTVNPVVDIVQGRPWDGNDHIGHLFNQVQLHPEEDYVTARLLFGKWLRGAVSVGMGRIDGYEHVLVWVEERGGTGKTRFFRTLAPAPLRLDGHVLDTADKDSVKTSVSHWLVELGELDATFSRSDIARIRSFLSKTRDDIRLPYGRMYNKYPRRTAFMASVNTVEFLVDESGGRRWWPIRITDINYEHSVDMQQVWAQAAAEVEAGEAWYLDAHENAMIAQRNEQFRTLTRVEEALAGWLDHDAEPALHLTCSQVLANCGLSHVTKAEINQAARWLRARGYREAKRGGGSRGFMVPPVRNPVVE